MVTLGVVYVGLNALISGVKKFIDFQRMVNERRKSRMGRDCLGGEGLWCGADDNEGYWAVLTTVEFYGAVLTTMRDIGRC